MKKLVYLLVGTTLAWPAMSQTSDDAAFLVRCATLPPENRPATCPATPEALEQAGKQRGFRIAVGGSGAPTAAPAAQSSSTARTPSTASPRRTQTAAANVTSRPNSRLIVADTSAQAGRQLDFMVQFALGSAKLSAEARTILDGVYQVLVSDSALVPRMRIEGHTDASGSRQMNRTLSKQRASAAVGYLVAKGIDPVRLEARGLGYDVPLAGRQASDPDNRRVSFVVVRADTPGRSS